MIRDEVCAVQTSSLIVFYSTFYLFQLEDVIFILILALLITL